METLQWQNIDKKKFAIFMRDLSENTQINLKHMVEDLNTGDEDTKVIRYNVNKNKYKNNRKPVIKKKDLIIAEQNKKRQEKELKDDEQLMNYLFENVSDEYPYEGIHKIKNEKYKIEFQCKLLEKYWEQKKEFLHHVFNLYYHLIQFPSEKIDEKYKPKISKIEKQLGKYDCKSYMLKELGHLLPPLDFWNRGDFELDDWQKECIQKIYEKKSILVKAPTSSGKTFIAMATGIIHKKILYVCPAKPVAYQVGSKFIKMGYKVHFYIENHDHFPYDETTNIFIGTPDCIENNLTRITNNFDYVVFDEIHMVGTYKSYENIIRCIDSNFLALSATIENIEYLEKLFTGIHNKKIEFIEYKKKFINQQRWIMNDDKLEKMHPCICMNTESLDKFKEITFTPNDCYELYNYIYEIFEDDFVKDANLEDEIDAVSIDNYYGGERLLSLDDVREYECFLKNKIIKLKERYPEKIKEIEHHFNKDIKDVDNLDNLYLLFKNCEKRDLLPLIYFHLEEDVSKEIFYKLHDILKQEETNNYPYHYDILEKKNKFYQEYKKKREIFASNIKIKTKDARAEKSSKLENFDKEMKDKFIMNVTNYYELCIGKCDGEENEKVKIKNIRTELFKFKDNPDFREQDIFKKHPDYCFTRGEPMSGSEIRDIRREIRNTTGINIDYENPIFQLLKRGIGLYIRSMPDVYNWILQRLMTEKKLGIIISDKTLCLGIDLPIRSVILSGYRTPAYTTGDYLQMSGRAGRRGLDNQGNIIFHNVSNYKELMQGHLPELELIKDKNNDSFNILRKLNGRINTDKIVQDKKIDTPVKLEKLLWNFRRYDNIDDFIKEFNKIEKYLFMEIEGDREYKLLEIIDKYLLENRCVEIYKSNLSENKYEKEIIRELGEISRNIYNSLKDHDHKITRDSSKKIFERCKIILE